MNTKLLNTFATASAVLLTLMGAVSSRAGVITVVDLPYTNTDIATGINTNKANEGLYVSCFDYGSINSGTTYTVNGVKMFHFGWATPGVNNKYSITNKIDPNFGGQVIITSGGPNNNLIADQGSTTTGTVTNQADGNMRNVLTDFMYDGGTIASNTWEQFEFDNLAIGDPYSLRIYYRYWGVSNRLNSVWFNGENTWQGYSVNPLDEDAGTNGVLPNGSICHGVRYIEYDFTASATNVFFAWTNVAAGSPFLTYASTLEQVSNIPPWITYEPTGFPTNNFSEGVFTVSAVGTPSLSYQWYSNSVDSYIGAVPLTDGPAISGSTTTNLTTMDNVISYYFAVVTNDYGSVTSSITQIYPNPIILTQPSATNVNNAYVQYSVAASGFPTLFYQWYSNSADSYTGAGALTDGNGYSGSLTSNLEAATNLQDYYFVIVTNYYGSITSAITSYNPLPMIVSQPAPFRSGNSVGFNITAGGWPTLEYQWYVNTVSNYTGASVSTDGGGVSGSQTASLTVNNLTDYYFVVVTNIYGAVTSRVSVLDSQPLTVIGAGEPIWSQVNQTNVIVYFSDSLDPVTATDVNNYSLTGGTGATVSSAAMAGSNEVVLTTASAMSPGTTYTLMVQNLEDYYEIAMAPSPTNLTVGLYPINLALWVRANTGVSGAGGNDVDTWNDLSGNNNTLEGFGEAPYDPVLATNAWGDTVVRFVPTNQLFVTVAPTSTLAITNNMTIVAVVNFATLNGGSNGDIVSITGNNANPAVNLNIPSPYDYYVGSANVSLYRGNGGSSGDGVSYGQFTATTGPSVGVPHVLVVTEYGSTVSHYVDGNLVGTGILNGSFPVANIADEGNPLFVGTRADNNDFLSGDLAELMIAGSSLSSYDVAKLTSYLAQEHNITIVNSNPTNLIFSAAGGNLTLSWPADHTGWELQAQTNSLSVGISTNWVSVPNSTTTDQVVIPINLTNGSVFYRLIYAP